MLRDYFLPPWSSHSHGGKKGKEEELFHMILVSPPYRKLGVGGGNTGHDPPGSSSTVAGSLYWRITVEGEGTGKAIVDPGALSYLYTQGRHSREAPQGKVRRRTTACPVGKKRGEKKEEEISPLVLWLSSSPWPMPGEKRGGKPWTPRPSLLCPQERGEDI